MPGVTVWELGEAESEKSGVEIVPMTNVTVTECDKLPLAPAIVSV